MLSLLKFPLKNSLFSFRALPVALLLLLIVPALAQVAPTPASERLKTVEQRKVLEERSTLNDIEFRNIGPTVMSGRVSDIDANPDDPTEFYVAYSTGGLWYTKNNGLSFTPIFDSEAVIGLGDIAVDWKTGTIWVGTGEVNSSRSSYAGLGMYKSSDKGKTWKYIGLPESHHIGKVQLHPTDPNTVWVAVLGHLYSPNAERGVYRTTNGGDTWELVLYVDENTGAVDLDINPINPNEIYAAMWERTRRAWDFREGGAGSGIFKSTDGGSTWKRLNGSNSGFPLNEHVGRIGLAVYPKNPQIVYAILDNQEPKPDTAARDTASYELAELRNLSLEEFAKLDDKRLDTFLKRNRMTPKYSAKKIKEMVARMDIKPTALYDYLDRNTGFEGTPIGCEIYRSDDGGISWKKTNEKEVPIFFTYGYYFAKIYVSPYNPDKVYALGFTSQLSTDGGKTFEVMDKQNVHVDHHALWINPKRDEHLINGNDGGINITYDNGEHWFKANTPPVGQFYAIAVDQEKPYNVYGGLQDNGVWFLPSRSPRNPFSNSGLGLVEGIETNLGGGDGMQVQVDWRDNETVYYGSQFGNYSRVNRNNRRERGRITPMHQLGERPLRFNWQTPIHLSRHNQDILYLGANRFYRSMDRGDTMIAMSADLTSGGKPGNVPYGTSTSIHESPLRFGLVYVGTDDGHLHMSKDAGHSWTPLTVTTGKGKKAAADNPPAGLWVSRVIASAHKEGRVYISLNGYRYDHFDAYVYVSDDYGTTWKRLGKDLPAEPVNVVLEDPKNENIIYVGTDGGLYVSTDGGESFMMWTAGLPKSIPIHDMVIHERENEIVLGTHGRSIYIAKLDEVQKAK